MGLLDDFSGFLKTPEGQGVLSGVFGLAAGARKGTPWNNLGRGGLAGLQGYSNALDAIGTEEERKQKALYNQKQQELLGMHYQNETDRIANERLKTEAQRRKLLDEGKSASDAFQRVFGIPVQAQMGADDYELMPVGSFSDMNVQVMDAADKQKPEFKLNTDMAKLYGMSPEDLNSIAALGQIDPKAAATMFRDVYKQRNLVRKPSDKVPTEMVYRTIASGIPLAGFEYITPEAAAKVLADLDDSGTKKAKASAPVVNVGGPTVVQNEKFQDGVGKLGAEGMFNQYQEAKNALTAVNAVKDVRALLDSGMFTGKLGPWKEQAASWYQAVTGTQMDTLDNTQMAKSILGDIVLPALSNLKGASSDRDFIMIEKYASGGEEITETALRGHLNRLYNKYGSQINNFNTTYRDYISQGGSRVPGMGELSLPSYAKPQKQEEVPPPANRGLTPKSAYDEYVDAYNRAKTPEQRNAINARARANGVIK